MNSSLSRVKDALTLAKELFRAQLTPLAIIFMCNSALSITLENALEALPKTADNERIALQVLLGLWDLGIGIWMILLLSWAIPRLRNWRRLQPSTTAGGGADAEGRGRGFLAEPFSTPYLGSFFAEYFRVLANVLLWGLLLFIPGLIRYCRLIFVPYVVLFSSAYRGGTVDAFRLSEALSRGRLMVIFTVIFLTSASQLVELLPDMTASLHTIPLRLLADLFSTGVSIWLYAFFYLEFVDGMARLEGNGEGKGQKEWEGNEDANGLPQPRIP